MKSVEFKIASIVIAVSLITPAAHSQSPREFDTFFSKFKAAVMSADTLKVQDLMAHDFDFLGTTNTSPTDVFRGLASSDQWTNLQSAVETKVFVSQPYKGKPARLLACRPLTTDNKCYVVFQLDSSGHWRWRAMVMPKQ